MSKRIGSGQDQEAGHPEPRASKQGCWICRMGGKYEASSRCRTSVDYVLHIMAYRGESNFRIWVRDAK